jgi:hypothetical protein
MDPSTRDTGFRCHRHHPGGLDAEEDQQAEQDRLDLQRSEVIREERADRRDRGDQRTRR